MEALVAEALVRAKEQEALEAVVVAVVVVVVVVVAAVVDPRGRHQRRS